MGEYMWGRMMRVETVTRSRQVIVEALLNCLSI